ncbi:venom toxin OcyC11-like [Penaeus monodon]|uniref:venom toxin OcyC11-like n=1 Tax=Penaeus monodon TaxID=6687 RepID=UPI0018A75867|nr:venom toxin OcyC11-like [Penaeus monodon]WKV34894.1 Vago transcript isoform 3 [Penaeus monodon]
MASLLRVLLLLAVVGASFAAIFRMKAVLHADYPGRCFDPSTGIAYPAGSTYPVTGRCAQIACLEENGDLYYQETSCGLVAPPENCRLVTDASQPFPSCCAKAVCK